MNTVHLDLDNFETQLSSESPYILTSPRSLKACATLGVQPNELVYRSLEEYEESLCDLPLSTIYRIYEENETRRQELLLACREERTLLIKQEIMAVNNKDNEDGSKPRSTARERPKSTANSKSRQTLSKSMSPKRITFTPKTKAGSSRTSLHSSARSTSGHQLHQTSDTESTRPWSVTQSFPDLLKVSKSNLDFRKVSQSPRSLCHSIYDFRDDRDILDHYLRDYEDILLNPDLTHEDRKIMECLILKRSKQLEHEKRSQEMRKIIEQDRIRRYKEHQLLLQSWHEKLQEKRKYENSENMRRYMEIQLKTESDRSNLMRYLEERDKRVKRYLDDINYKKKKMLLEKQRKEALKQLEVGHAIEKLVEQDRQQRLFVQDKLARRMEEAEIRKRRQEKDYFRHVAEMNRLEEIKRSLKLEALEQKARESVEELKNQIEEKEHRARINYLNKIKQRDYALIEGSGTRQQQMERAKALHSDLLKGLEEWHKRVLDLHTEAQKRAELKYQQEIHRRRIRAASDRILREERSSEMLRKIQDLEEQRRDVLKATIETKDYKSQRVKADKDRKVHISRIRAQHAAELRQQLRSRLDPDTFDRKVQRAEIEGKILLKRSKSSNSFNRMSATSSRYLRCLSSGYINFNPNNKNKRNSSKSQ